MGELMDRITTSNGVATINLGIIDGDEFVIRSRCCIDNRIDVRSLIDTDEYVLIYVNGKLHIHIGHDDAINGTGIERTLWERINSYVSRRSEIDFNYIVRAACVLFAKKVSISSVKRA